MNGPHNGPHVAVVGAGIVGAACALYLARAGARVTVVDRADGPGRGVTAASFGWVGLLAGLDEQDDDAFARRLEAVAEWRRLIEVMGSALPARRVGAIAWGDEAPAAGKLAENPRLRAAGIALIARAEIAAREPALRHPPPHAALAADEWAVETEAAAQMLLRAAAEAGARLLPGVEAVGLARAGGRAIGLDLAGGDLAGGDLAGGDRLAADHVLLAAGTGTGAFLGDHMPAGAIRGSDAVMLRFTGAGAAARFRGIVCGPEFEARTAGDGTILCADLPGPGRESVPAIAAETAAALRRALHGAEALHPAASARVARPWTADGAPVLGPVPGLAGASLAVLHPGVILAPWAARLLAASILEKAAVPAGLRADRRSLDPRP
ncbi:FAD-dependent oxidoreductase [Marivibrio halodurans]|uniref:FAD-dependent oxidoreductase n=1 Tax=Marivibrio halodurans TaxID=2039722 RepID=A0A8J7SPZ9_9PROT|nr:FAD-dependent oxidoreductase [Marivibrio halodurans]MBP5858696.1 FAD-dependent oxidoreductase [Marivibrio halodurans]